MAWLAAQGLKETGSQANHGVRVRIRIEPGPVDHGPVEGRHLLSKIESALVESGRATIEHVLRRPAYQKTAAERWRDLAETIAGEWDMSSSQPISDWSGWTG
jgi:hypothetical protein